MSVQWARRLGLILLFMLAFIAVVLGAPTLDLLLLDLTGRAIR
jgi:hypothetical protein